MVDEIAYHLKFWYHHEIQIIADYALLYKRYVSTMDTKLSLSQFFRLFLPVMEVGSWNFGKV